MARDVAPVIAWKVDVETHEDGDTTTLVTPLTPQGDASRYAFGDYDDFVIADENMTYHYWPNGGFAASGGFEETLCSVFFDMGPNNRDADRGSK